MKISYLKQIKAPVFALVLGAMMFGSQSTLTAAAAVDPLKQTKDVILALFMLEVNEHGGHANDGKSFVHFADHLIKIVTDHFDHFVKVAKGDANFVRQFLKDMEEIKHSKSAMKVAEKLGIYKDFLPKEVLEGSKLALGMKLSKRLR